ncbi:MAG: tRNA ((32)/uridine(32)-2-O)-methyltransferase TrmJ [Rhodocyclales bacterium]|nr:tRNA ((32)/uridine(32)-2-O)-methyltransferase TrmJ [Rhodocyclales bacterium]MDB5887285.1 tRNA ((32)/uridine(32)-2-O)-methyltransferase TrmJ [Rhodocyclales bacterium]
MSDDKVARMTSCEQVSVLETLDYMSDQSALSRVRVVLVQPSHPGNIGAAARAMKTMGLSSLYLVRPKSFPHAEAHTRASGATDVLDRAIVTETLGEALVGVTMAAAMTSRRRELSLPMQWSRDAAQTLSQRVAADEQVALVFGNETYGLSNEDLALCQLPVMIPANPDYASLNLGAAVQLMSYEMRMATVALGQAPAMDAALATVDEVEQLMQHIERATTATGFFDPANPKRLMPRLRRMFGRIALERDEVNILRGMISFFERPLAHRRAGTIEAETRSESSNT